MKSWSVKGASLTLLFLFIVILPLFIGPGPVNTRGGGDSPFLYWRLEQLVKGLRAGQFPVRWMPDAAYGLGYPFFNFYAALPYYLAAIWRLLGCGPILSIQLTQAFGFLLAAATMALLARRVFTHPAAQMLTVIAYTVAPFHLVNVYVRGDSLSEFYAFVFYPLIVWALFALLDKPTWSHAGLFGLSYGGLILTHNLSAIMFSPFVAALALYALVSTNRAHRASMLFKLLVGGVLGLALSAALWLVAVADLPAVRMSAQAIQTSGYFNPIGHLRGANLVQPRFFFDYEVTSANTPFAMGAVQAATLVSATGLIVWSWLRRKRQGDAFARHPGLDGLIWVAGLLVATWLMTTCSKGLWQHMPILPIVQFPWRFLSVQAFFGALVLGKATCHLSRPWWGAWVVATLLLVASVGALRPEYLPIGEADINDRQLALFELFSTNIGTTIRGEYLPAAVEPRPYTGAALLRDEVAYPRALTGELTHATLIARDAGRQCWDVQITSEYAKLVFYTYYFPGWTARVDGQTSPIDARPNSGLISLTVPHGTHRVELRFERTPLRWLADGLSLTGTVLCLLLTQPWVALRRPGRREMLIGVLTVIAIVAVMAGLVRLKRPVETVAPSFDFDRMPFLHSNPHGIDFGHVRLNQYTYNAQVLAGGDRLDVQLDWTPVDPTWRARLDLLTPALDAYPAFAPVPAPLAFVEAPITTPMTLSLTVPADVATGIYYVSLRVFYGEQEIRAITAQGHTLGVTCLRPVWIANRRAASAQDSIRARFGDEIVLRDDLRVQSTEGAWDIRLTWQALKPLDKNYTLSLRMLAADGTPLPGAQRDLEGGPGYGFWPTTTWLPGEWLTDHVRMAVPEGIKPDQAAALMVVLYDRAQPGFPALGSAVIPLIERTHQFTAPPVQHPLAVAFGEKIALLGYNIEQNDVLRLTLYWQATQSIETDYTVFVHLFDPTTETIVRQIDARPLNGLYPTNGWLPGEVVADTYVLPISGVAPGEYALAVGLYDARDWTRLLPVDANGSTWPDGRLILQRMPLEKR